MTITRSLYRRSGRALAKPDMPIYGFSKYERPSSVPLHAKRACGVDWVGTICLFFYVVQTELKKEWATFFYKHCVPTGLKTRTR